MPDRRAAVAHVLMLALVLAGLTGCGERRMVSAAVADRAGAGAVDPRQMTFPPVEFNPPEPERVVLDNGMVVYLLEDHELPLITMSATMRTGGWLEPDEKLGLAGLTGLAMRTGGTERLPAAELDQELERLAAVLTVSIGVESGVASLDLLQKDLDRGLTIFADVLRRPAFEPARVELAKLQARESIRRRHDQPQSIASREFAKLLYGPAHPFARESTVQTIGRITRDDLIAFHAATIHPNGIILGVTGDFDRAAMLAKLHEVFGDWAPGPVQPTVVPPPQGTRDSAVRFIVKGTSQTHLRAGHLSLKETDPDYPALVLLNDILGGGSFRSRLFQDIRTRQGLAYSISSVLRGGIYADGVWGVRTETKSASTQQVVATLVANLTRLHEQPVTEAELEEAKEAFVNSFIFSFTSPASIVNRRVELEYDGLPKDFLQQLRDKVMKLTAEDLLRVARKHLHPDRLKILAVGPPENGRILAAFGEPKEIHLEPDS
ncbi:M16 family metallopeptidase [Candidatus Nitrospira bockiana]